MPKFLNPEQVECYEADGYAHPIPVLTADEAADYRRRFEEYETANGGWYELSKGQKLYLLQTWLAELVSNARVLDAVEDILGPDIMCWGASLFVKDANDPGFVSWHQDSTYWGLSGPEVVTAWIALSSATKLSGCMKMLPGGNKIEQLPHRDTLDPDNLLTRGQELQIEIDESAAEHMELAPGEMSLHNIRAIHASEPNASDDRRIGVAIRYIAPHLKQVKAAGDSAWLVRGEDKFGHFILETPPQGDMDTAAVAEHARIMKLRQGVLYKGVEGAPAHADI